MSGDDQLMFQCCISFWNQKNINNQPLICRGSLFVLSFSSLYLCIQSLSLLFMAHLLTIDSKLVSFAVMFTQWSYMQLWLHCLHSRFQPIACQHWLVLIRQMFPASWGGGGEEEMLVLHCFWEDMSSTYPSIHRYGECRIHLQLAVLTQH